MKLMAGGTLSHQVCPSLVAALEILFFFLMSALMLLWCATDSFAWTPDNVPLQQPQLWVNHADCTSTEYVITANHHNTSIFAAVTCRWAYPWMDYNSLYWSPLAYLLAQVAPLAFYAPPAIMFWVKGYLLSGKHIEMTPSQRIPGLGSVQKKALQQGAKKYEVSGTTFAT